MTTILRLLFSLMKMVFLICWKIVKIICGPMMDSLKHIGKVILEAIKERYKKRKEGELTFVEKSDRDSEAGKSASSDVDGV